MKLVTLILAAGQGSRMRSQRPKVLHTLAGRPLLAHVLDTAAALSPRRRIVVYGHGGEAVKAAFAATQDLDWVEQAEQLGTGHAVAQAIDHFDDDEAVLVLYGDVPLIRPDSLTPLVAAASAGRIGLLTAELADPTGYGRIVRNAEGAVQAIVEHKDATPEQLRIREVNTGLMAIPGGRLRTWLTRLNNDNAQGEYYLTDLIAMAVADGVPVEAVAVADANETLGVNTRAQLAALERLYQGRAAEALMAAGLSLADPARFDLRGRLTLGQDCYVDINAVIEGDVSFGNGVVIGPNCIIRDSTLGDGVVIEANSIVDGARVDAGAQVGPFARLRPGAELERTAKVGNFVEVKKAVLREGAKVNHLSYIGDAEVGRKVNVGAGTITCNYDGVNKHRTVIGDGAFIGSGTNLVAPVVVGAGATIGAGSTITRDAPAEKLTLSRARQSTVPGWKRPEKQ